MGAMASAVIINSPSGRRAVNNRQQCVKQRVLSRIKCTPYRYKFSFSNTRLRVKSGHAIYPQQEKLEKNGGLVSHSCNHAELRRPSAVRDPVHQLGAEQDPGWAERRGRVGWVRCSWYPYHFLAPGAFLRLDARGLQASSFCFRSHSTRF